ncbi:MAG: hypothetical protein D3910_20280 [Candidatus Electrothrix sp. ATG2]|nr:hypothetical protein [Candidatus Electrothrix sp. ATG2]
MDEVDDTVMMYMVQGHHPMKKMALHLMKIGRGNEDTSFSCAPLARLMKKILRLNYSYWLTEENPQPWFESQCGSFCSGWQAGSLLTAISHDRFQEHISALDLIDIEEDPYQALSELMELPAHIDIVRLYRAIPKQLTPDTDDEQESSFSLRKRRKIIIHEYLTFAMLNSCHFLDCQIPRRSIIKRIVFTLNKNYLT